MTIKFIPTPTTCDLCREPLGYLMYDCRIGPMGSPWGCICERCFIGNNCSIGPGLGQRYQKQDDGSYVKSGG